MMLDIKNLDRKPQIYREHVPKDVVQMFRYQEMYPIEHLKK